MLLCWLKVLLCGLPPLNVTCFCRATNSRSPCRWMRVETATTVRQAQDYCKLPCSPMVCVCVVVCVCVCGRVCVCFKIYVICCTRRICGRICVLSVSVTDDDYADYSWYGDAYWTATDSGGRQVAAGTLMVSDEQAERLPSSTTY